MKHRISTADTCNIWSLNAPGCLTLFLDMFRHLARPPQTRYVARVGKYMHTRLPKYVPRGFHSGRYRTKCLIIFCHWGVAHNHWHIPPDSTFRQWGTLNLDTYHTKLFEPMNNSLRQRRTGPSSQIIYFCTRSGTFPLSIDWKGMTCLYIQKNKLAICLILATASMGWWMKGKNHPPKCSTKLQ